MKAFDFSYDDKNLSDFGFIIANFDEKGLETIDGAEITFNTISSLGGLRNYLISTQYDNCLEITMQIAKYSCSTDIQEISSTEFREISRWLNRKKFLKFKILDENHIDLYYMASIISINRIELDGRLMGLELNIITNSPHAFKEPRLITITNTKVNGKHSINDISHEEGYIYPHLEITISQDGDLNIYNAIEDRNTYIKNCVAGEVITMDYPIISSSISSHNIQNDFNWNFFRVANTFENSRNDLTISLPCSIKIEYSPIVKVGL
ncbi:MAG: hypothetical protein J6R59_09700 [Paludibacteraceae bacterium]|nr:hypothetical protein [Paludibacteraceae bacterium]